MKQKIIGISPRFIHPKNGSVPYLKVNADYLEILTSRGFIPFVLVENDCFEDCLSKCDGFLIIGGDDINPIHYGQNNDLGLSKEIDDHVDLIDKRIIEYAIDHKVPILGICRGLQSLAVFMGGSLHQDIATANLIHPSEDNKHIVSKVCSTELTDLLPNNFLTNTFHHQCINKVPTGFKVIYKNYDVIEGIEHETLPFYAFQWHPERYYTNESKIIVDYFAKKVHEYGKNN